jgi:Tfp pilus assembly pilus retraction ATPase PilT
MVLIFKPLNMPLTAIKDAAVNIATEDSMASCLAKLAVDACQDALNKASLKLNPFLMASVTSRILRIFLDPLPKIDELDKLSVSSRIYPQNPKTPQN